MRSLPWLLLLALAGPSFAQTWTANNGNGTYSNPLFFNEFSDSGMIRVGRDFYLTGTTMHSMPGLPVRSSRRIPRVPSRRNASRKSKPASGSRLTQSRG